MGTPAGVRRRPVPTDYEPQDCVVGFRQALSCDGGRVLRALYVLEVGEQCLPWVLGVSAQVSQ
jgi:hypothetical protein